MGLKVNMQFLCHEQGVIRALEVAANTVEELAKGSEASQDALEVHCKTFLENVQVFASSSPKH